MSEIKIGEYVRTEKGKIFYIDKYEKIQALHFLNAQYEKITRHSKKIIDLIKEGDYVNGHKVIDADDCVGLMREVYCEDDEDFGIWDEMIEEVLTKEQYEQNCYRLEEENG